MTSSEEPLSLSAPPSGDCVAVQLTGGLANQMFQYAAGRALADRRSVPLVLDQRQLAYPGRTGYQLGALSVRAEGAIRPSAVVRAGLGTPTNGPVAKAARRYLTSTIATAPKSFAAWSPRSFSYDAGIDAAPRRVWLRGHFQSERYFADAAEPISADLRPKSGLMPAAAEASAPSIAVHVRRGDYLATGGKHPVMPLAYYHFAIRRVREVYPDAELLCYSDTPEWADEHLGPLGADVVHTPADAAPYLDLVRMSRASALIIANSSYSWWAAWLSGSETVVAPDVWFGDGTDTSDILPARWERMSAAAETVAR